MRWWRSSRLRSCRRWWRRRTCESWRSLRSYSGGMLAAKTMGDARSSGGSAAGTRCTVSSARSSASGCTNRVVACGASLYSIHLCRARHRAAVATIAPIGDSTDCLDASIARLMSFTMAPGALDCWPAPTIPSKWRTLQTVGAHAARGNRRARRVARLRRRPGVGRAEEWLADAGIAAAGCSGREVQLRCTGKGAGVKTEAGCRSGWQERLAGQVSKRSDGGCSTVRRGRQRHSGYFRSVQYT